MNRPALRTAVLPVAWPHWMRALAKFMPSDDDSWLLPATNAAVAGRPVVAGVDVEVAQEREHRVAAVPVVGVADEQVDHAAVLARRGPRRVELGEGGGRRDVVAVVEVVVVELGVGAVRGRVADQRAPVPRRSTKTRVGLAGRGGEPVGQPGADRGEQRGRAARCGRAGRRSRRARAARPSAFAGPVGVVAEPGQRVAVGDLVEVAADGGAGPRRSRSATDGQLGQYAVEADAGGERRSADERPASGRAARRRSARSVRRAGEVLPLVRVERDDGARCRCPPGPWW